MSQPPYPESIVPKEIARNVMSPARFAPGERMLLGAVAVSLVVWVVVVLFSPIVRGADTYVSFSRLYIWTEALRAGDPLSIWTPIDASGFGSPVPFFYHKLFNLVGAALSLATGDVVTGYRFAILTFSSVMFYGVYACAARLGADRTSRLVVATASVFAPYMLTKAIEGGVAEYSATTLIPLILALLIDVHNGRFGKWQGLSLFVLLLLLAQAHVLVFVIASGVLLMLTLYLIVTSSQSGWPLLAITIGALAVFFATTFVPFTWWSAYFCPAQAKIFGHISDNLLSVGYIFWRSPRSQFGWPVFALMIGMAFQLRRTDDPRARMIFAFGGAALLVILLMTRLTRPLWHISAQLDFVQFPWRLLSLAIPLCLVVLAGILEQLSPVTKQRVQFGILAFALATAAALLHFYGNEYAPIPLEQLRREAPPTSVVGPDAGGEYYPAHYQPQLAAIDILQTPATGVLPTQRPLVEASGCRYTDIPRPAYFNTLEIPATCAAGGHVRINQFSTPFLTSSARSADGITLAPVQGSQFVEYELPAGQWTISVRQRSYLDLVLMAWRAKLAKAGL
ncbi:hypothetical protein [Paraburkholderia sp. GAS42]|uniref:hypothetical protein n=1 Tax=Paraburkholderia sp. GAS42 TaxID=3035135 RepID=UPI003D227D66